MPTKNPATPLPVSFKAPGTPAFPTALHDADGEAVRA